MRTADPITRWAYGSAIGGGIAWVVLMVATSAGVTPLGILEQLFLLAPLVIVPLGLTLVTKSGDPTLSEVPLRGVTFLQPFAAILVVGSFWVEPGISAAALVSSWMVLSILIGISGLDRLVRGGFRRADEVCFAAGLMLLPVGAGGLFASRLGLSLLGFQEPIVFLTAVHFHYAGFATPLIAGATGRAMGPPRHAAQTIFGMAAVGVTAGPPLIATGFLFSPILQVLSVLLLSVSLILLSAILVVLLPTLQQRLVQVLLAVSACSLIIGMFLAGVYAIGEYTGNTLVSIPRMASFHGILNAIGFSLCGLLAWALARDESP